MSTQGELRSANARPVERHDALSRLDDVLERAYDRLAWRLPLIQPLVATALGALMVVPVVAIASKVERLADSDELRLIGLATGIALVQGALGVYLSHRALARLGRDLSDGRDARSCAQALQTAYRLPFTLSRLNAAVAVLLTLPAMLWTVSRFSTVGVEFVVAAAIFGLTALAVLVAFGVFGLQLLMRPLIRDAAHRLDQPPLPTGATSVRAKLLVTIPLIAVFTGLWGVWLPLDAGADWGTVLTDELLVAAVGLAFICPAAFMLAFSTLRPLDDLLRATHRLKRGDLGTRIAELSGDEYGRLARSFNEAMVGLEERAHLATENDRLLLEVRASRARIVAAIDAERRRVERNIHDGAQQRLVALNLDLTILEELADSVARDQIRSMAADAGANLRAALDELRELARGLHPSVLESDGLGPALKQLASRSTVPVTVDVSTPRLPAGVESTIYFIASEALANVSKYADASRAAVAVAQRTDQIVVEIRDDGVGGAAPERGSGLTGLADRVAALDGRLLVDSPPGAGTTVRAELPALSGSGAHTPEALPSEVV